MAPAVELHSTVDPGPGRRPTARPESGLLLEMIQEPFSTACLGIRVRGRGNRKDIDPPCIGRWIAGGRTIDITPSRGPMAHPAEAHPVTARTVSASSSRAKARFGDGCPRSHLAKATLPQTLRKTSPRYGHPSDTTSPERRDGRGVIRSPRDPGGFPEGSPCGMPIQVLSPRAEVGHALVRRAKDDETTRIPADAASAGDPIGPQQHEDPLVGAIHPGREPVR
jgi:hypothetical protein